MARALFISHILPYPIKGGDQIRISQQLESLTRHYDVDLVYVAHRPTALDEMRRHLPALGSERAFYVPRWLRAVQASATLVNALPMEANLFHNRAMQRYIDREAAGYDLVFCAGMTEARYMLGKSAKRKILDLTDCFTMNLDNAAAIASGAVRTLLRANARRMRRYEQRCIAEFDRVAFISTVDRDYLSPASPRCVIVGNSTPIPSGDKCCRFGSRDILFIGKMDYAPNIAAVSHFATEIMPRVLAKVPDARFIVAGANPPASIRALKSSAVEILGFVDDIDPLYASAGLVVAPMLSGSGIQNKIIQSLARGCAVVTTKIGAEGLDADSGAFAIANDDITMARQCISLLSDCDKAKDLGARGREYARLNFSPEAIARQFDAFVSQP